MWGGGSPTGPTGGPPPGFDCSGLLLYAVYQASDGAIQLPHYTVSDVDDVASGLGEQVFVGPGTQALTSGLLEPGDAIFFQDADPTPGWDHVGIYVGGGDMIDAPYTGADVQVDDLTTMGGLQWDVIRYP